MPYLYWLLSISLAFSILERLWPERPTQPPLRRGLLLDLFYLLFNGHFYAVLAAGAVGWTTFQTRALLERGDLLGEASILQGQPFLVQAVVYFVISDFLQWCVHVLLHKVPPLWRFHQIHHSVIAMDWAGNFRFHWMEIILYRSLLYVPLLFLGGEGEPLFAVAVVGTAWGHFNHSNLRLGIGPLAYLFNSPRMHLWHHDASSEGGISKNYGIVLSLWDWLFRTAYWPRDRAPAELGYPGLEALPGDLPRQLLWPLKLPALPGLGRETRPRPPR